MLKSALLVTASMIVGAGSVQLLHSVNAATGPSAYVVYEANITDEAAYTKALPDVEKIIKESGGTRIAGGFYKDGVPWNNSVAENAIKHFARYRTDTAGLMTEVGLDDYLILLSVYVTCRYKGVSFLKFLLSKSRDIDAFCARPTRRARSAAIELYPQGFDSRGPLRRDAEQ